MNVAQKLFEGGHITYLRTDSPAMAEEAIAEIRQYCQGKWPLSPEIRRYKARSDAQGAHECIRPTHIEVESVGDTDDERALYALIRIRSLATQLADEVHSVRVARLKASLDGRDVDFEARGRTLLSQGWRILLSQDDATESAAEPDNPVPKLETGTLLNAHDGKLLTKQTMPPPYFTEATLTGELERKGIGRPATFAAILSKILERGYVALEKKKLVSTYLGELIVDSLVGGFGFVEFDFTRDMEKRLDDIAEGKARYLDVVTATYEHISRELERFCGLHPEAAAFKCPECHAADLLHLFKKQDSSSQGYDYFKCPECKSSFTCVDGKPGPRKAARAQDNLSEHKCLECKKPLIRKQGQRKDGSGEYDFYGCSGWSKCNATYQVLEDGTPDFERYVSRSKGKRTTQSKPKHKK